MDKWREDILTRGQAIRGELARRALLVRQPKPNGVRGPSARLVLGEIAGLARRKRLSGTHYRSPSPQPVMLIPGFASHPLRMRAMRRELEAAGHFVTDWGQGFNLGPTAENFAALLERIERFSRACGGPVVLVGWSLGGLFAREAANILPGSVSRVITMGTPFSGNRRANNAWRAYQLVTGHSVDDPPIPASPARKPPVPTIALWSPRDGVVAPRSACGQKDERDRAVALRCTHLGFVADPEAIAELLRQLDSPV